MNHFIFTLVSLLSIATFAQKNHFKETDLKISSLIEGSILLPLETKKPPLAIIIGGSGPVDKDGNQNGSRNNSLKLLAEGLTKKGIATFRYDKRIVKQIRLRTINEENIRFNDFITDANNVLAYFKKANSFSKIVIIGHSQGSLVGMISANNHADSFISLSGAGQQIDEVIINQLEEQAPGLKDNAKNAFNDMRKNGVALNYSPGLASIFRPQIQAFMLSWMKYDPRIELAKLDIPVLIINGDNDLQVKLSEAEKLKEAKKDATYEIIENMNHVLKEITGGDIENSKSYNNPTLPVSTSLINCIANFILQ